jgi:hypothetical protein
LKLFLADGRLGNQIFQYVFLKTVQENNEQIIVSGFEDLKEVFEINDIINLNKKNRWTRVFLFRACRPIFNLFSDKSIISSISIDHEEVLEKYRRESTTFTSNNGFLSFITFVKLGFFQSEYFFNDALIKKLSIKSEFLNKADFILRKLPKDSYKVFIHVRVGDGKKKYTVYGKETMLPISYYKDQIEYFIKNKNNPFFVFLSNDAKVVKSEFGHIKNKLISVNNSQGVDLSIMTKCNGAILSASTFGWWGAYLMDDRDKVFTPKYWSGFNSKIEYHAGTNLRFATEVEVEVE